VFSLAMLAVAPNTTIRTIWNRAIMAGAQKPARPQLRAETGGEVRATSHLESSFF
jgi:hypothetical protein